MKTLPVTFDLTGDQVHALCRSFQEHLLDILAAAGHGPAAAALAAVGNERGDIKETFDTLMMAIDAWMTDDKIRDVVACLIDTFTLGTGPRGGSWAQAEPFLRRLDNIGVDDATIWEAIATVRHIDGPARQIWVDLGPGWTGMADELEAHTYRLAAST